MTPEEFSFTTHHMNTGISPV